MTEPKAPRVYCYSGTTYAEEPRALDWEGKRHRVDRVVETWRTPEGPVFQVQTKPGNRFVLHYHESEDRWTVKQLTSAEPIAGQSEAPWDEEGADE